MTQQEDPIVDAELSEIDFTPKQAAYLAHHLANGLMTLGGVRDIRKLDEMSQSCITTAKKRLKQLLNAVREIAARNHAEGK